MSQRMVVVGRGRAGGSFAEALRNAGWDVEAVSHTQLPHSLSASSATAARRGDSAELVLLCVPDAAVAEVAATIPASESRVVAHCSGSLGLDVLAPAPRRASVHPLASLPDAWVGAQRLNGAWFAISGDPIANTVVDELGGHTVEVGDDERDAYHAAAAIASNHVVALVGQLQRVAVDAGVPLAAYRQLAADSLAGAFETTPADALTGPVSRGDWGTVERHLAALDSSEREAYVAMARLAARLAGRELPEFSG